MCCLSQGSPEGKGGEVTSPKERSGLCPQLLGGALWASVGLGAFSTGQSNNVVGALAKWDWFCPPRGWIPEVSHVGIGK